MGLVPFHAGRGFFFFSAPLCVNILKALTTMNLLVLSAYDTVSRPVLCVGNLRR